MQHAAHQDRATYRELVERYGEAMAFGLLLSLERSAKLTTDKAYLSEEERLDQAIKAMNKTIAA